MFLIIDDEKSYVEALHRNAQKMRILFKHHTNLEEARQFVEGKEARAISGIVLDVKCMVNKLQTSPKSNFIMEAVKYFQSNFSHIPIAILTGEPEKYKSLKEDFEGAINVYYKGKEEEQMLISLAEQAQQLDYVKLVKQYPDVFDAVENYLNGEALEELIGCLKGMQSSDFTSIKDSLARLRRLQEKVYIALNRIDPAIIPADHVDPKVVVTSIYKHLTENGYVKRYSIIDRYASTIYGITSDNGSHTPYQNPEFPPTKYTVQAMTFAILDLLLWFKNIADSKFETK